MIRTEGSVGRVVPLLCGLLVSGGPVGGQSVIHVPSQPSCPECEIRLEQVVVLGDREGPGTVDHETPVVKRDSRGRYYMSYPGGASVKVFGPDGSYLTTIGRRGKGPGEFEGIIAVRPSVGDSIHVFDINLMRLSVFGPDYSFVRSDIMDIRPSFEVLELPRRRWLVNAVHRSPERIGLPLHVLDARGHVLSSFGSETGASRPDRGLEVRRRTAVTGDGSVWAAKTHEYVVELWTLDGTRVAELRRQAAWFPRQDDGRAYADRPPRPILSQVQQDPSGLLWVTVFIADPNWRDAIELGGSHGFQIADRDGYRDTVIDVIDPEAGTLMASRRIPQVLRQFVDAGLVGQTVYEDDLTPRFVVWRLSLVTPDTEGSYDDQ